MDKANKLKQTWQKEDDFLIDSAVEALLKAPNGRKMLWWLLEIGKIGLQPFAGNALATAFACGELNVGQRILDRIITVSPDGYVLMMKENEDATRSRAAALADAHDRTAGSRADGRDYDDGDTADDPDD